jgi:hypothetical protein
MIEREREREREKRDRRRVFDNTYYKKYKLKLIIRIDDCMCIDSFAR